MGRVEIDGRSVDYCGTLAKPTNSTDRLTATISVRLTEDECRTLAVCPDREQRTVSQLVRLLLRNVLQHA